MTFPAIIYNPPQQPRISYRWGDFPAFRLALLQPVTAPPELELTNPSGAQIWRPADDGGDLALQVVEWWAYLADILTLYTERAANQAFVRTADLPESLPRLVRLLGYRPRPAIGAQVTLAGIVRGARAVTLPQGLQVQSKPGPGALPQIFELAAATVMQPMAPLATVPQTTQSAPVAAGAALGQVLLAKPPAGLKTGDEMLVLAKGWTGSTGAYAVGAVTAIAAAPGGTSVAFTVTHSGAAGVGTPLGAANWRLLKAAGSALIYPYVDPQAQPSLTLGTGPDGLSLVQLASVVRSISPGDAILIEDPTSAAVLASGGTPTASVLGWVTQVEEVIYYANNPTNPIQWPPDPGTPPSEPAVPIPHTVLRFVTTDAIPAVPTGTLVVRYGFADLGTLVDAPVTGPSQAGTIVTAPASPTTAATQSLAIGSALLVADANGDGAIATVTAAGGAGIGATVTIDDAAPLVPPLTLFSNLLAFSRGKTVRQEVLGNGNPAVAGQDFTLRNTPVTYLADSPGRSGPGFTSTVTLWVNTIKWTEVPSFFGQPAAAQVFVTSEDTSGNTHVTGGDGVNGARFPSGTANIVASYRTGAGAGLPPPTSISVLLQPQPGLAALVNPVPPSGGQDPDAAADLRRLAPASVTSFGRAVSVDDYASIAAATPGVARVSAAYVFDPVQQRPVVTLWVGDSADAVTAAQAAIAPISDPNRPVAIRQASQIGVGMLLTYVRDPSYMDGPVNAAVQAALQDPAAGLFAAMPIGRALYDSQIYQACLAVPGVQAVQGLEVLTYIDSAFAFFWRLESIRLANRFGWIQAPGACVNERYDPGPDSFFVLTVLQVNGIAGA